MTDPWEWTVDQVVFHLCQSRELWADEPGTPLPDPQSFEHTLRENDVDGKCLLENLTLQRLKDDLGILSFGKRSALERGINRLKAQSPLYATYKDGGSTSKLSVVAQDRTNHDETHAPSPRLTPPHRTTLSQPSSPKARPGEVLIESRDGGKKRRKILLDTASSSTPVLASSIQSEHGYLGRAKLSLDDIFYPGIKTGQRLDDPAASSDEDFEHSASSKMPPGRRDYLSRRLRFMLRNEPQQVSTDKLVITPYPARLVRPRTAQFATLIKLEAPNTVVVTKRDAIYLDSLPMLPGGDGEDNHDWDFLAKWTKSQENDEILPTISEEGSQFTYDAKDIEEMAEDDRDVSKKSTSKFLASEDVAAVVDDTIKEFRRSWEVEKLPWWQSRARRFFNEARGRIRQSKLDEANRSMKHLEARIARYREGICDEQWTSRKRVASQCAVFEATVTSLCEIQWKRELWNTSQPPPRTRPLPRALKKKGDDDMTSQGDDDAVDIESDIDDLDDFLDKDDDDLMHDSTSSLEQLHSIGDAPVGADNRVPSQADKVNDHEDIDNAEDMDIDGQEARKDPTLSLDSVFGNGPSDSSASPVKALQPGLRSPTLLRPPNQIIDLTLESDREEGEQEENYGESIWTPEPEKASRDEISAWDIDELQTRGDRKRLIIKLLDDMDQHEHARLIQVQQRVLQVKPRDFEHDTRQALIHLPDADPQLSFPGVLSKDLLGLMTVAKLFVCWVLVTSLYIEVVYDVPRDIVEMVTAAFVRNYKAFHTLLKTVFGDTGPFAHIDYDEDAANLPTRRRRKRQATQANRRGRQLREEAVNRRNVGVEREKQLQEKLQRLQDSGISETALGVVINPMDEEDAYIYINPFLANRMKAYQVEGVRFIWREIVNGGDEIAPGCLLAHTMGLGKTLQTIAVLNTISESNYNPARANQIPEGLRTPKELECLRVLVLCPAGLIENWEEELRKWRTPDDVHKGGLPYAYAVSSAATPDGRETRINAWYNGGGVLIMGYERFRQTVQKKPLHPNKARRVKTQYQAPSEISNMMLQGPNIVVADEAHKFKNLSSGIADAIGRIKTPYRIALTGSPLANNMGDYYAMINWVAPGFLGDLAEFKEFYRRPIEDGFYADSSRLEQRISLKKQQAFKDEIDPKVHRKDMSVLKDDLQPKTEFVIELGLTSVQQEAYTEFIRSLVEEGRKIDSLGIVDWIAVLALLCFHPTTFLNKLMHRKRLEQAKVDVNQKKPRPSTSEEDEAISNVDVSRLDMSTAMLQKQRAIASKLDQSQLLATILSPKTSIIEQIVRLSKEQGDRVLIFSHYLPVLDYLQAWLTTLKGIEFVRLDGKTNISMRTDMAKKFNDEGGADVFLISTKAGGLGLNLPGANRVILVDFSFNPTWEEQAVGRAYRIGQKKAVFVYHLVCGGTFERELHQRTIFKKQLAIRVVDKKNAKVIAEKIDKFLFEPRIVEQQDLAPYKGMDKILDRILESPVKGSIRSLQTADVFHAGNETLTEEEMKEVEQLKADKRLRLDNHAEWLRRRQQAYDQAAAEQLRLIASHGKPEQTHKTAMRTASGVASAPSTPKEGNKEDDAPSMPSTAPPLIPSSAKAPSLDQSGPALTQRQKMDRAYASAYLDVSASAPVAKQIPAAAEPTKDPRLTRPRNSPYNIAQPTHGKFVSRPGKPAPAASPEPEKQ